MKRRTAVAALPNIALCGRIRLSAVDRRGVQGRRDNIKMGIHSTWSMGGRVDTRIVCFDSKGEEGRERR